MAKDLRLDVVTDSDPKGLISTAVEIDHLADKAEKLGHKFDETAVEGAFLAKELEAVRLKNEELARSFDQTGDRALLKQIAANKRYETQLKNVGKELENVGKDAAKEGEAVGDNLGQGTLKGLFNSVKSLGDGLAGKSWTEMLATPQGIVAAGAAGYLLGGAVLTGIGLAGVGSGIVVALHDPAVKTSLDELKKQIGGTLKDSAKPFVAPLSEALDRLGADVQLKIGPGLSKTFKALAPEVLTLERGVEGFLNPVVSGFEKAALAAKPLLEDFGNNDLPALGQSIKGLFEAIASAEPTASNSLHDLMVTIDAVVNSTSFAITSLGKLDDLLNHNPLGLTLGTDSGVLKYLSELNSKADTSFIVFNKAATATDALSSTFQQAQTSGQGFVSVIDNGTLAAKALKAQVDALKAQWDKLDEALSKQQAIDTALDTLHNAFGQATQAINENGKSLDNNTAKGRKNQEMYLQDIATLKDQRDALAANGETAAEADKQFQGWIKALDKAMEKAGFSKKDIDALNAALALPINKPVTITINGKTAYVDPKTGGISIGGHKALAAGGRYKAGEARLVGEKGPELDIPDHSGTIIPNSALKSSMAGTPVMLGGGGGTTVVQLQAVAGDQVAQVLLSLLRPVVRGNYNGDVTAALGGFR